MCSNWHTFRAPLNNHSHVIFQHVDQSLNFSSAKKNKNKIKRFHTINSVYSVKTYIRTANCSVGFIAFDISSVFAIIVYIPLMLPSIQSVNLFTEFLYVSTLSAVIDDMECNKLHKFSVKLSTDAAKYCASTSTSFSTLTSMCCSACCDCCRNCRGNRTDVDGVLLRELGNDDSMKIQKQTNITYFERGVHVIGLPSFVFGLDSLILYSRFSVT